MSHWYDSAPKKSRRKRDSNPRSSALEADALPLGHEAVMKQRPVPISSHPANMQGKELYLGDIREGWGVVKTNLNKFQRSRAFEHLRAISFFKVHVMIDN